MAENIQQQLRQEGSLLSWLFFPAGALLAWGTGVDQLVPWLPFLISIAIIGLPHGAADWILLRPSSKGDGIRKFLMYSLVGALTLIVAIFEPAIVMIGFLILTIIHFGLADDNDLRRFGAPASIFTRGSGIYRMAIFFSLVCLSGTEGVIHLTERIVQILPGSKMINSVGPAFHQFLLALFFIGAIGWTLSLGFQAYRCFQKSQKSPLGANLRLKVELMEGVVLIMTALYLHPVFSVGLYFLTWHALRHSVLLAGNLVHAPLSETGLVKRLAIVHLRSCPLYLPVIPLIYMLVHANGTLTSPIDWVAAFLVICIVFTLPHHFIVERLLNGSVRAGRETHGIAPDRSEFGRGEIVGVQARIARPERH